MTPLAELDPALHIEPWCAPHTAPNKPKPRLPQPRGGWEDERVRRLPYDGPYERLPHGPHSLDTTANHRHRLTTSLAQALREHKPRQVAHILPLAGVSRRSFYETFVNYDDCYDAALDAARLTRH